MTSKFAFNNFLRKTYNETLFNSFILPWNCHDLAANKQNYFYTHRYKAILGFDFSYVMRGAQFPEFEDTGFAGIGFFSSFGETSWIILETTDGRLDIRGAAKRHLPVKIADGGLFCHFYNGIYYNIYNSVGDQINNLAPHYSVNIFSSIVNFDRGVQSYLEQTYWQHTTPGHWRNAGASLHLPGILSVKPCARSDSFLEFFSKPRHWITKLNYLSLKDSNNAKPFSNMYRVNRFSRARRILFADSCFNDLMSRLAWKMRAIEKLKILKGSKKKRFHAINNACYMLRTPDLKNRSLVMRRLRSYWLKSLGNYRLYASLRAARIFQRRNYFMSIKRGWKKNKKRLPKKLRPNYLIRSKLTNMKKHAYTNKFNVGLRALLSLKKGVLFRSWRFNKKKRRNRRLWYLDCRQQYRNPLAAKRAVRYKKAYKKRKYIFVI